MRKRIYEGAARVVLFVYSLSLVLPCLAQQGAIGLGYFVDVICAYRRDRPRMTTEAAINSYLSGMVAEVASNGAQSSGYMRYWSPTRNVKGDQYNAGIAGQRFTTWQKWVNSLPPGSNKLKIMSNAINNKCP